MDSSIFTATVLASWETEVRRTSDFFDKCNDADLLKPVAPGRNRIIYLLGHLVAVSDRMLPLLGLGERHWPHLDELFVTKPEDVSASLPAAAELRAQWREVNNELTGKLKAWKPEEWLMKHESVSAADFAKEPHRNRLNVVLSRTSHMSYHRGQLVLVKV